RRAKPVIPFDGLGPVLTLESVEQTPEYRGLAGPKYEFEHVADPRRGRRGADDIAVRDRGVEALRIAVGADRQRGAREVQQAHQGERRSCLRCLGHREGPRCAKSWMMPACFASLE